MLRTFTHARAALDAIERVDRPRFSLFIHRDAARWATLGANATERTFDDVVLYMTLQILHRRLRLIRVADGLRALEERLERHFS